MQNHYVGGSLQSLQSLHNSEGLSDFYFASEIRDASSLFLSERILSLIAKHSDILESIHISDQYTGFVQEKCVVKSVFFLDA